MNLDHQYKLTTKPNLGKRFIAGLIDYGLIFSYFLLMIYLFGKPNDEGGYSVTGLPAFSIMIFWFIMTVGIEQLNGATLGNQFQNLRPIPKFDSRKELTIGQSIKRHLLDPIDLQIFGLIAVLTIRNTEFNQRLGDLWAKTVVIDKADPDQGLK